MQLVLKSTEICNVRYVLESCIKNNNMHGRYQSGLRSSDIATAPEPAPYQD